MSSKRLSPALRFVAPPTMGKPFSSYVMAANNAVARLGALGWRVRGAAFVVVFVVLLSVMAIPGISFFGTGIPVIEADKRFVDMV